MQNAQTIALISIDSIGAAVVTMQDVAAQDAKLKETKKAAGGTIAGAVKQTAKTESGEFLPLSDILQNLCIPATVGRLRRIQAMKSEYPSLDWSHIYSNTTEDAMTDKNKTAAYNAAKMALSRMKKAEEDAAAGAAASEAAAAEQAAAAQALAVAEQQAATAAAAAAAAAEQAAAAEKAKADAVAELEAKLFAANARIAELEADNATLSARLEAAAAGNVTKGSKRKAVAA